MLLQETAADLEAESAADAADELEGQPAQPLSRKDILVRAVAQMGAGIALCAVFSDPLVDALTHLSRCGKWVEGPQPRLAAVAGCMCSGSGDERIAVQATLQGRHC